MSQPGREFRLEWKTAVNEFTVRVSIYEADYLIPDGDTPEVIELQPAGNPLIFSTIDNNRDKYTPVRAKQAVISFLSGDYDINTFFDAPDDRWLVVITLTDSGFELFRGFVALADLSQPFQPDPVTVTLTATDKLGTLSDVPCVNYLGNVPTGKILFSQWLYHCLHSTGMNLDFQIQYNIRELETHNDHLFWKNYLDALTFEDEVGTLISSREVLERILGKTAFLTQWGGKWWIKRVDEFDFQRSDYVASFTYEGIYESIDAGTTYVQNIGTIVDAQFCNADQIISSDRPHKFIKLEYRYELPKELPCNKDFDRGDYDSDIDSDTKKYDLDCWELFENRPLVTSTTSTTWIERNFTTYEVEEERYVVIDVASSAVEQLLKSSAIEVQEKDKFDFSFAVKYNGQVETSSGNITTSYAQIHLHAHDGTYYTLDGGLLDPETVPEWVECTSNFNTNQRFFKIQYDGADDDTEWRSGGFINGDCPPVPKAGYIYIVFCHQLKVDEFQLHISSLNFTLYPYVNGSYKKFTSHTHKVSSTANYLPSKDEQVFISDRPHPVYKGAIFRFDDDLSRYVLGEQFYDHTEFPVLLPGTGSGYLLPFGELQARDFWNQYKFGSRILESSVLGLDDNNPADVIHRYIFTDTDPNINGRTFMCIGFEQDWKTEKWRGSWVEVYRNSVGRTYDDPHEFKYQS